ncbi:hypothetical protein OROGR_010963 [Orobanche gracilis]
MSFETRCAPLISSSRFCGLIMTSHMLDGHVADLDRCTRFLFSFINRPIWRYEVDNFLETLVLFKPQPKELQDCCNGVLLIAHFAKCPRQYYVCNPTTHQEMNSPSSFMVVVPREYSKHFLKLDVFSSRLAGKSSDSGRTLLARSQAIELPGTEEFDSCGSFGVSKGDLVYSNSAPLNIVVWVLENGARWVLQHRISVPREVQIGRIAEDVCFSSVFRRNLCYWQFSPDFKV